MPGGNRYLCLRCNKTVIQVVGLHRHSTRVHAGEYRAEKFFGPDFKAIERDGENKENENVEYLKWDQEGRLRYYAILTKGPRKLFLDAGCELTKAEAEKVATRHKVQMKLVSNGGLRLSQIRLLRW